MSKWLTIDNGTSVDVIPYKDTKEHRFGDECWCFPKVEMTKGVPLVTHVRHVHVWGKWNESEAIKVDGENKIISIRFCQQCTSMQPRIGTLS